MIGHNKKFLRVVFYYHLLFTICYLLSGCATVSIREPGLTSYNIDGVDYLPLITLCELRNIDWDYDTFTRRITLVRGHDQINLMIGSSAAIVNGRPEDIKYPVRIYKGAVVLPYRFKKTVIDSLFGPYSVSRIPDLTYARSIRRVLIDPGHGGRDLGAIGRTGLKEKDVNLDIAKRLKNELREQGIEVILTRQHDEYISLQERSRIANTNDIDLFISIHANANRVRRLRGFEVYYLTSEIDDCERALSTAKRVDLNLDSACFASQDLCLKATIWDLIYTQQRAESIELARHICRAADNNLYTKIFRIRGDRFYVLKNSRMPAILIEVGYLSNRHDESLLRNNFYRQQITESIALGIESFRRGRTIQQAQR